MLIIKDQLKIMLTNPGAVVGDVVVFGSLVADSYRASEIGRASCRERV